LTYLKARYNIPWF